MEGDYLCCLLCGDCRDVLYYDVINGREEVDQWEVLRSERILNEFCDRCRKITVDWMNE